ncbi:MAG: FimV/HubP family polar landmark protein [Gammaproteobacteria bacterium]
MVKRLVPVVIILGWLIPGVAMALGLGPITMRSALNQPLLAEIDIHSVQPGDLDSLAVRLATDEDFKRINIERPSYLSHIQFKVVVRADGSAFVRLSTTQPVTEPYLDFLVEARWARGRALKEYTVLVDPPVLAAEAPAPVEQPSTAPVFAPPPQQQAQQAQRQPAPAPQPRAQQPRPQLQPAPRPAPRQFAAPKSTGPMDYGMVRRGDTLWEIAEQLRKRSGTDATVHQIMMALLRANPKAFVNGNVNQLKAGYVLRIENPDTVADISQSESLQEFKRQYREWRSATGRLVQQVEVASGDVEEPRAAPGSSSRASKTEQAKLQLVAPGREGQGSGSASRDSSEAQQLRDDLILTTEALDASRQESEELKTRLTELDEQLESMQRLITLKDEELLAVQNQLKGQSEAEPAAKPEAKPKPEQAPAEETASVSFLSDYLLVGVALLAVIGVVAWLVIRRRKMQEGFEESILNVGMGASAAAAAAAMTAQARGSESGESSMVSDFAMSDMAGIQSDAAEVDPISEADVYLAYGRHQQAEDIIKQAMETNPGRIELQTKLLEVYHAANNRGAFEQQAQALHDAIGGDESNEHWQRIVGLGSELCPDNPLFGGSMAAGEAELGFDTAMSDVTAEEEDLLDFDFNEDEIADLESVTASTDDNSMDFDVSSLDFNLDDEPKTAKAAAVDNSLDFDMGMDEHTGDFDEESTELNLSLDSDSDVDLGSIDFETETGIAEAPTEAIRDVSLSLSDEVPTQAMEKPDDMGLSLEDFDSEETLHANSDEMDLSLSESYGGGELSLEDLGEDEELGDDIFADVDEIGTKLDLAKAYVDMGDSDGARSILDEVMEEGDDTQKEQAQQLLRQIG